MVRKYKGREGARRYEDYTEQQLERAVLLIKSKRMRYTEASKTFNIPRRTLMNKVNKKHEGAVGAPQLISPEIERSIVDIIIASSEYGCPISMMELRIVMKSHLDKEGVRLRKFKDNSPGVDWCRNFIARHKHLLSNRQCQNIKKARAEKTDDEMNNYFDNLENNVVGIPPSLILNYDETNLTDDPGSSKCIFRRGIEYPERVMNSTKSSISVMFAATADGTLLAPYAVYKAERLYDAWCIGGPEGTRYNGTKSGWLDQCVFEDWFTKISLPWAKEIDGPKALIGDNLSSHLNITIIRECQRNNIRFIFLPSNSTHLTQPLDVSFCKPLKVVWRRIITTYKTKNPRDSSVNRIAFPHLVKKLIEEIKLKHPKIIQNGFIATGIYPCNREEVLRRMPNKRFQETNTDISDTLLDFLEESRTPSKSSASKRKKMLKVEPGKSVATEDFTTNTPQEKKLNKTDRNEENDWGETESESEDKVELDEEPYQKTDNRSDKPQAHCSRDIVTHKTENKSKLDAVKESDFIVVALLGKNNTSISLRKSSKKKTTK